MSKITWDESQNRFFEYGVSKGVHYLLDEQGKYSKGVAWNGLTNISDNPSGADIDKKWADGILYATMRAAEEYASSIEAFTYPDQFALCDGSAQPIDGMYIGQQKRVRFGLCWRTEIGNADDQELGYKLHLAYGLTVSPSQKSHDTVNDSPEMVTFSWDAEGQPVPVTGFKPTAKIEIDSRKFTDKQMKAIEDVLYGTDAKEPTLPLPDEVKTILDGAKG
ncbi:MAG: hypothetical protein SPI49_03345 [Eubacteriales bacterium]|nr:hypothetical protein [Eubacteriales bacterium]